MHKCINKYVVEEAQILSISTQATVKQVINEWLATKMHACCDALGATDREYVPMCDVNCTRMHNNAYTVKKNTE